jgi:hypothetical protein
VLKTTHLQIRVAATYLDSYNRSVVVLECGSNY